jgi:hypothetical protein
MRKFFGPTGSVSRIRVQSEALRTNMLGDPSARVVDVYVPAGHNGEGLPLLVDLVGFTGSGLSHTNWVGFRENLPERLDRLIDSSPFTRPRVGPKAKIPNHDGTRLRFARASPLEGSGFELPVSARDQQRFRGSAELRPIDPRRGGIIRAVVGLGKSIELLRRLKEPPLTVE